MTRSDVLACSFCAKTQRQVRKLISGPGAVCICDECVGLCNELIEEEATEQAAAALLRPPTPRDIHAALEQYVVGQDAAKTALSVAVYNHYKRVAARGAAPAADSPVELGKSNILLIGPTGCGKTYLAQTLARTLGVPFAIADATALTQAGYVGEDVDSILAKLIQAADGDVRRAETGIVYIDEIDKIARGSADRTAMRDVSGEGVQQALLKILEGSTVRVPQPNSRKQPAEEFLQIDTTDVLFILGGAFSGLEEIIEQRSRRRGIGFGATIRSAEPTLDEVMPADLVTFGMIPEFVGRLPIVTTVRPFDQATLMRILTEPRNALIKQYQLLFELDGVELEVTPDAVGAIAEQALLRRTGARATRAILEEILLNVMYEVPSRDDVARVVIDRATVLDNVNPTLVPRDHPVRRRARRADTA
ncbi:ATP-dependent Clp protease ATP-binding subunit ClpX [Catellatospora methionotrophica]|uniref:ATP-dependent Clp protease ATP-binding subunit ClpX n=1 Tax=Catellatospora methionotrophica TaxID=121620 RepID=A0A8J3LN25_9ACTN|nr:ATP-dependent Clp protease ATP-binding subunit ClpX [Catellatospora methionotrophica]GIG18336.1 ATP-dependent Clp protease ATP-binding subunit ClpX [Catellatospora methionotrophica]